MDLIVPLDYIVDTTTLSGISADDIKMQPRLRIRVGRYFMHVCKALLESYVPHQQLQAMLWCSPL
jgi:hypothetical protein